MSDALSFTLEQPVAGVTEVVVRGDVDLAGGKPFERALADAAATSAGVLVNLADCSFLDSSGLNALIRFARGRPAGRHVAVYCLPEGAVRQVFSLTRAYSLLDVHDDRGAALGALALAGGAPSDS